MSSSRPHCRGWRCLDVCVLLQFSDLFSKLVFLWFHQPRHPCGTSTVMTCGHRRVRAALLTAEIIQKCHFPPVATPVQSLVRNLGPSSADNCILIELNSSQQSSHPITTLQSCPEIVLQVIYKSCSQVKRTKINFSLISKLKSFEIRFFFFSSDFLHSKLAGSKEAEEEWDMAVHPQAGPLSFLQLFWLPEGSQKVSFFTFYLHLFHYFSILISPE